MLGRKYLRGAIWDICYLRRSDERPFLTYAHSLNVLVGDLLDEVALPSNNDFLRSVLINEGVSGDLSSYYEAVHDSDLIKWGNLLLWRKRQFGKRSMGSLLLEQLELLVEEETRRRRDQLSLENIFTTGLPRADADRFYSPS